VLISFQVCAGVHSCGGVCGVGEREGDGVARGCHQCVVSCVGAMLCHIMPVGSACDGVLLKGFSP